MSVTKQLLAKGYSIEEVKKLRSLSARTRTRFSSIAEIIDYEVANLGSVDAAIKEVETTLRLTAILIEKYGEFV